MGAGEEASWVWMSRAREMRDVRGIRWWRRACWAEIRRSHSRARAWAREGFVRGIFRRCFVGVRRGRVSRWIW